MISSLTLHCDHLLFFLPNNLPVPPPAPTPTPLFFPLWPQQQQLQHLSHHAPGIPLTPHPSGLSLGAGGSGLLALTGALGVSAHLAAKDERNHLDPEHLRGIEAVQHACDGLYLLQYKYVII